MFLRLWAVVLLVRAATIIVQNLPLQAADDHPIIRAQLLGVIASATLTGLIALGFLLSAPRVAARLSPENAEMVINVRGYQLFVIALTALGLFFVVTGAERLVGVLYLIASKPPWDETGTWEYVTTHGQGQLPPAAIRLLAGALLLQFRRTLAARLLPRSG
jgi:hypothetical protein